jgi:hypothetical protein
MKPPDDLGTEGRELLSRISAFLDGYDPDGRSLQLDPHEEAVLVEACRLADRLAQIRAVLVGADLAEPAGVRLLAEERQQRATLATLLITKLGLPTGLVGEPATPRSRRAQKAAHSRWATHTKRGA